jgi:hypothetical protein
MQPESIKILLSTVTGVSTVPEVVQATKLVVTKFTSVFTHFEECHTIYNGRVVDDATIDQLGRSV